MEDNSKQLTLAEIILFGICIFTGAAFMILLCLAAIAGIGDFILYGRILTPTPVVERVIMAEAILFGIAVLAGFFGEKVGEE